MKLEEGFRALGTEVLDGCKPSCGYWELNQDSLQEQMFLTIEPSLAPNPDGFIYLRYLIPAFDPPASDFPSVRSIISYESPYFSSC